MTAFLHYFATVRPPRLYTGPRIGRVFTAAILVLLAGPRLSQIAEATPGGQPAGEGPQPSHVHSSRERRASGHDHVEVALSTTPETPRAGTPASLTFTLTDGYGHPINELITHHARRLHVVIVSEDMQIFGHIHPSDFELPIADGKAEVSFAFPQAGRYMIAADFMTTRGSHAAQFILELPAEASTIGTTHGPAELPHSIRVVDMVGDDRYTEPIFLSGAGDAEGYTVSLRKPERIRAGEPVSLVYSFSYGAAPVTDLQPYLAAPLHLAAVKDDLTRFLHEHGSVSAGNHAAHGGNGGHASHAHAAPSTFGPEISVILTFPEPGAYYLFAQTARGSKLLVSRFHIEVR